jgi:hypothetical protein
LQHELLFLLGLCLRKGVNENARREQLRFDFVLVIDYVDGLSLHFIEGWQTEHRTVTAALVDEL